MTATPTSVSPSRESIQNAGNAASRLNTVTAPAARPFPSGSRDWQLSQTASTTGTTVSRPITWYRLDPLLATIRKSPGLRNAYNHPSGSRPRWCLLSQRASNSRSRSARCPQQRHLSPGSSPFLSIPAIWSSGVIGIGSSPTLLRNPFSEGIRTRSPHSHVAEAPARPSETRSDRPQLHEIE